MCVAGASFCLPFGKLFFFFFSLVYFLSFIQLFFSNAVSKTLKQLWKFLELFIVADFGIGIVLRQPIKKTSIKPGTH